MSLSQTFSVLGLLADIIGVALLGWAFFIGRARIADRLTPKWGSDNPLDMLDTEFGKKAIKERNRGVAGTIMLVIGFALQLTGILTQN